MKVVNITLAQLLQLKFARKTFLVLTTASWLSKSSNETIRSVQLKLGSSAYVLFRLSAEVNSEEEEYIINDLQIKSLPSIVYFKHGIIDSINDLSGNSDLSNMRHAALRMEELITYHPRNTQTGLGILNQLAGSENSTGVGRLFISGDRSSVGKSSMCLAILVSLLKRGVHPSTLAYIKPVTQCEAEQPITQFCNRVGIANRGIGPIVFYKGFTRAFLNGETSSADILLNEAENAVAEISQGKQFVVVDGVGYPSVGSICNLSNADVAAKLRTPVLLISKSGVGDAVDSYNLNSAYFEHKKVHVLGGMFNKLPQEGYYSLENCREAVTEYFLQFKTSQRPYGFIPVIDTTVNMTNTGNTSNGNDNHMEIVSTSSSSKEDSIVPATAGELLQKEVVPVPVVGNTHTFTAFEEALSAAFLRYVDIDRLLHDVWMFEVMKNAEDVLLPSPPLHLNTTMHQNSNISTHTGALTMPRSALADSGPVARTSMSVTDMTSRSDPIGMQSTGSTAHSNGNNSSVSKVSNAGVGVKRSREEVEAAARKQGAKGG